MVTRNQLTGIICILDSGNRIRVINTVIIVTARKHQSKDMMNMSNITNPLKKNVPFALAAVSLSDTSLR